MHLFITLVYQTLCSTIPEFKLDVLGVFYERWINRTNIWLGYKNNRNNWYWLIITLAQLR